VGYDLSPSGLEERALTPEKQGLKPMKHAHCGMAKAMP
jgi:hypothetical protein